MTSGTPKTLLEAISNGIELSGNARDPRMIERHVRDFLNQKATTALVCFEMLEAPKPIFHVFIKMLKDLGIEVRL